jgi:hypothetical protein
VTDRSTEIVWQKCSKGQNNNATCSGGAKYSDWIAAINYCEDLTLADKSWRLPSAQELETLVDNSKSGLVIDTTFFPETVDSWYWSSTTFVDLPKFVNVVHFGNGSTVQVDMTYIGYVRCVTKY